MSPLIAAEMVVLAVKADGISGATIVVEFSGPAYWSCSVRVPIARAAEFYIGACWIMQIHAAQDYHEGA